MLFTFFIVFLPAFLLLRGKYVVAALFLSVVYGLLLLMMLGVMVDMWVTGGDRSFGIALIPLNLLYSLPFLASLRAVKAAKVLRRIKESKLSDVGEVFA
jgi:hypothetical protein